MENRQWLLAALVQARAARVAGAPINPEVVAAMAALETGYGASLLAREYRNLLGIKAGTSWVGPTVNLATQEVIAGDRINTRANWRVYTSWRDCFIDYGSIIDRLWWFADAKAAKDDPLAFLIALLPIYGPDGEEVLEPGHATDPRYQQKVLSIVREHQLLQPQGPKRIGEFDTVVFHHPSLGDRLAFPFTRRPTFRGRFLSSRTEQSDLPKLDVKRVPVRREPQ